MASEKKTIVCIEDEPQMIDLFRLILCPKGFDLVGATRGQQGLQTMRHVKPDLLLLDLAMPDMDGWSVCKHMEADEVLRHIPVIVVTARATPFNKVIASQCAQVVGYMVKPFGPSDLVDSVERVLGSAN